MAFKAVTWEPVPLLIGLAGSTGSGKTKSALELATGICGDKRFAFLDTEKGRGRHYLKRYEFDYDQLQPPFTPEAYAAKIREAVDAGYPLLVIDSTSHMWEGIGGLREDASTTAEKMAAKWNADPEKYTFSSWNKPKQRLNEFVMLIQQCPIHLIFTFRAKEKLKQVKNDKGRTEIVNTGWKPIIDESLPFEMTMMAMFHPEAPGVPVFDYKAKAEYLPNIFQARDVVRAQHGQALAEWSQHGEAGQKKVAPKAGSIPLVDNWGEVKSNYDTGSAWLAAYRAIMSPADEEGRTWIARNNIELLRKLATKSEEAANELKMAEHLAQPADAAA